MSEKPLILECTAQVAKTLDGLMETGLFGPTRDAVAQRLLELKLYEMAIVIINKP